MSPLKHEQPCSGGNVCMQGRGTSPHNTGNDGAHAGLVGRTMVLTVMCARNGGLPACVISSDRRAQGPNPGP